MPALNPDVALIHAQQADIYGNARVFGTGIAHEESALASKKVIISAEEIIDTDEIRRDPGRTSIPYYAVDAVVHAPFGAWPGNCGGYYGSDTPAVIETFAAISRDTVADYIAKYITPFATTARCSTRLIGQERLDKPARGGDDQRRVSGHETRTRRRLLEHRAARRHRREHRAPPRISASTRSGRPRRTAPTR